MGRLEYLNLQAQSLKASPHILRPRVGVRLLRLHQPRLVGLSQTTQSTSPCLPLACLDCFLKTYQASTGHRNTGCFTLRQGWKQTWKRLGETVKGRTWRCRRNACPSGDHSFSSWSGAQPSPRTYKQTHAVNVKFWNEMIKNQTPSKSHKSMKHWWKPPAATFRCRDTLLIQREI